MICAVNHGGDSDSTGAIAGNILGAYLGRNKIDPEGDLEQKIESGDVIVELAADMTAGCKMSEYGSCTDEKWCAKYVYCNYGKGLC